MIQQAERLQDSLRSLGRVVIAFSGGVDSSVVAAAAIRSGIDPVIAVTAQSASVPEWQIKLAKTVADQIGVVHRIVGTGEVNRDDYRRNTQRRCYFCKQTLYRALSTIVAEFPGAKIVSGTNADDLGDYRPGIEAGLHAGVLTPLADLGYGKSDVRRLARHYGLPNHDLPASPCLASRIAYGTEVTVERLRRIERAEDYLRGFGFSELRVRLHEDEVARIEVPKEQIPTLVDLDVDGSLSAFMLDLGFKFVSLDMTGFRTGSMNRVLVNIQTSHRDGSDGMARDSIGKSDWHQEAIG